MTRETKAGIVVSSSFLCLVGVVLFSKWHEKAPGTTGADSPTQAQIDNASAEPRELADNSGGPLHTDSLIKPAKDTPLAKDKNANEDKSVVPAKFTGDVNTIPLAGVNQTDKNATTQQSKEKTAAEQQAKQAQQNAKTKQDGTFDLKNEMAIKTNQTEPAKAKDKAATTPELSWDILPPKTEGEKEKLKSAETKTETQPKLGVATVTTVPATTVNASSTNTALQSTQQQATKDKDDPWAKVSTTTVPKAEPPPKKEPASGEDLWKVPAQPVAKQDNSPKQTATPAPAWLDSFTNSAPKAQSTAGTMIGGGAVLPPLPPLPAATKPAPVLADTSVTNQGKTNPAPISWPSGSQVSTGTGSPATLDNPADRVRLGSPNLAATTNQVAQVSNPPSESFNRTRPALGAPLTAISAPIAAPVPSSSTAQVESFDEETYTCRANDSFAAISQQYYQTQKYERALFLFNRNHPLATNGVRQDPPALQAGQPLYIPPARILEKMYGTAIVEAASKVPTPAGQGQPAPVPEKKYRVQGNGEMFWQIARQTLGNENRWAEIYALNKSLDPKDPIPAGTELRLPADARLASEAAP